MVKEFGKIRRGPILGKTAVSPINLEKLSFDKKIKTFEAVNMIKEKDVVK